MTDFAPLIRLEDLPPKIAAHAREFVASGREPVTPRPAATVLLLSQASDGYRVFMVRRAPTMPFAPGLYAFPGGSVDARDVSGDFGVTGARDWPDRLGQPPELATALVRAAIREVFEETGVLLAEVPAPSSFESERAALVDHRRSFADFVAANGLTLRDDLLTPWSRWITPAFEPRRYDTSFFLARLPEGQTARNLGGEADEVAWLRPADTGDLAMLRPTRVTLAEISGYAEITELLDAAAGRDTRTPIMPRLP